MPKSCGKCVQNLWKLASKTCQNLSTYSVETNIRQFAMWVKPQVFPVFIPGFPSVSSTPKNLDSSLLLHSFTHNPHPLLLLTRKKI